jgi:predicted nucleotidyltransferase
MKTTILNKLLDIEKEHKIKMLFACESGSRGWQFASPDSDYDVRFIYTRTTDEYLSLAGKPDQLSFPINDELDIYGWDLSKTLKLILRSNTTPFEWLQSPIIYREEAGFRAELMELCKYYFSQRSNSHHYLGIARGAMETMNADGMISIKKLFYVLRPMLAAKWCLERNTIAPMTIGPLMTLMPDDLRLEVERLIDEKASAAEGFLITPDAGLLSWIKETEQLCIEQSDLLPKNQFDASRLDHFFRKTIAQYDHSGT